MRLICGCGRRADGTEFAPRSCEDMKWMSKSVTNESLGLYALSAASASILLASASNLSRSFSCLASSSASLEELQALGQLAELMSDPEVQALISEAEALRDTRVQARMPGFIER